MSLNRERAAIIGICIRAAETNEEMLKMLPHNLHYQEHAAMARWIAAEIGKRMGMEWASEGEIDSDALANLKKELTTMRETNTALREELRRVKHERDEARNGALVHKEALSRTEKALGKTVDAHLEKDERIKELEGKLAETAEAFESAMEVMKEERKMIKAHERGVIASMLRKMAKDSPDPVEDRALNKAADKTEGGLK